MKRPVIYDVNQKKPAIASGHSDKIKETKEVKPEYADLGETKKGL